MSFREVTPWFFGFVFVTGMAWAQTPRTVYIDPISNNGPANWNNLSFGVTNNTATLKDSLTNSTGIRATVKVSLTPGANVNTSTAPYGDAAEFAPAGVNSAYGHSTTWSGVAPILYGEVVFSNLLADVAYSFTFYASRVGVTLSDNREARYSVTGANSGTNTLNASNNSNLVAAVSNIFPRADGTITLRVEKGPANNNSPNYFYYLTAMKITYAEPPPPPPEPRTTVYVDVAGSSAATGWNLVGFNTLGTTNIYLNATNGAATGIGMLVTAVISGLNTAGTNNPTGDAAEFAPAGVQSCFGYNTLYASPARPKGVALFSALNTNVAYTFTFYGSRMGATDDRSALFTLSGATSGSNTLNAAGNYSSVAVVSNIYPAADGTITLEVTKGPTNNNSSDFFYVGAMKITFAPYDPPVEPPVEPGSGKRLLFFGNSFSMGEDVPGHVGSIAAIAGHPAPLVVADLYGGTDLAYHIGQVDAYPGNNVTNAALAGTNTWDHVVIQGYSTEATHLRDTTIFRTNALALYRRVKDHASGKGLGVQPVLFQTWARAPGHTFYPGTFPNPAAMQMEIRTNYQAAAELIEAGEPAADARIAPVGDAFELAGFNPADLYSADLYHAGNLGPELAALILYKAIYGATVTNIPYAAVQAAGWTTMNSNDWTRVTYWAEGLTPPGSTAVTNPPPAQPAFGAREVFLLDAGNADAAGTPGWNTLNLYGLNTTSLVLTNGLETDAACTVVTRMTSLNTNGSPTPTGEAAVFAPAGANNAYGNVNPFGGYSNLYALVRFSGLNTGRRYSFTLYASRMSATDNREALYTLTGANSGSNTLNAANNSAQVAKIDNILPRPDGTIDLRIEPGPNNNNAYKFYHLSAIRIESLRKGMMILIGP